MRLFGKAKSAPPPSQSIQKLDETIAMLEKRETYLQTRIEKELQTAKANATKNKKAAMAALKRKKLLEAQAEKLSGARLTLEQQKLALEGATVSMETMKAMQTGAKAMKGIHKDLNIDKVEDTMDEIREQMDLADEINNAIAQPLGGDLDDAELEAELAELEEEGLDEQLLTAHTAPALKLPSAPTKLPAAGVNKAPAAKSRAQTEEDELAALEASMALS